MGLAGMGLASWPTVTVPSTFANHANEFTEQTLMKQYGMSAAAIDIFMDTTWGPPSYTQSQRIEGLFNGYITTASANGFRVAPFLERFNNYSVNQVATVLNYLVTQDGNKTAWVKYNGKYVVFMYVGTAWTSNQWSQVLAQCPNVYLILDSTGLAQRISAGTGSVSEVDQYYQLSISIAISNRLYDPLIQQSIYNAVSKYSAPKVGDIFLNYYRRSNINFRDPKGTQFMRDEINWANSWGFDSKFIFSWDDLTEDHDFMPSDNNGLAKISCLSFLLGLTTSQSIYCHQTGETTINGNVFSEVTIFGGTHAVQITLCDSLGRLIDTTSAVTTFGTTYVQNAFTAICDPNIRYGYLLINIDGVTKKSPPILFWPQSDTRMSLRQLSWNWNDNTSLASGLWATDTNGAVNSIATSDLHVRVHNNLNVIRLGPGSFSPSSGFFWTSTTQPNGSIAYSIPFYHGP